MLKRYERLIIRRYLLPGRGEGFIFLVGVISLLAVALGVAALVAVMSVMNGFRIELFSRILGLNGQAIVQSYDNRIGDWRGLLTDIRAIPGVTDAVPLIERPLMISFHGRAEGVLLRGMQASDISADHLLMQSVTTGSLSAIQEGSGAIALGARLARSLGAGVGDDVSLLSTAGRATAFGTAPRIVSYRVAAIMELGVFDYDKVFALMSMGDAQRFLGMKDEIGVIEINTADPDHVDDILAPVHPLLAGRAVLTSWKEMNSELFEALVVERVVMFWVLSIIILVAVFNILSSLIMLVRAKTRDIAILRTIGVTRGSLLRIFISLGTMIGATGMLMGLGLGFALVHFRSNIVAFVSQVTGANLWDPSVRYLTDLPARTDPLEILGIAAMTLFLSFLATIYPAWRAASTDPVEVLRYD